MPIYEYRCPKCEVEVEKYVRKLDAPPPTCDGDDKAMHDPVEMQKMVSEGSFKLKGGGWYKDGYGG